MSKTETIDEMFHVHSWRNSNYILSTSHSGNIVLEWLTDNKNPIELEVRI